MRHQSQATVSKLTWWFECFKQLRQSQTSADTESHKDTCIHASTRDHGHGDKQWHWQVRPCLSHKVLLCCGCSRFRAHHRCLLIWIWLWMHNCRREFSIVSRLFFFLNYSWDMIWHRFHTNMSLSPLLLLLPCSLLPHSSHPSSQPSTIWVLTTMPCSDSGLPHDTRNIIGTSGNVFERLPAGEGLPSALFENSKNLASSSHELRPDITGNTMVPERDMKREQQNSSISVPRFQSGGRKLKHTGGTFSHGGMIEHTRFPISEMHLGKFPDSMEFQSWKVYFKTEVCPKSADPHLTMHWIKEVEIADELMTSRSIMERTDFLFYDMLDAMIASALLKLLNTHVHFRKRASVEEQRAQQYDRISRGRQNCSHDLQAFPCNWSSWSSTRTLRFVQMYASEWRRPRLRRSMGSSSIISKRNSHRCDPGRIVQVKIAGFYSASDCLGFVRTRNCSKQWTDKLFTIENSKLQSQQKVKERWCERISCFIEGVYTLELCVSGFLSEKIKPTWRRKIGTTSHRQILEGHVAPNENSGKRVHRKELFNSANPMSAFRALPDFEERTQDDDIAGIVFNNSSPRAKWRTSSRKLVRITPKNPKPK